MSSSNIQAVTKSADASAVVGRSRLMGVYYTCTATGASISFRNGALVTDPVVMTLTTPAAAGAYELSIPDMGILFTDGIFIDVSSAEVTSVTALYQGGAAA